MVLAILSGMNLLFNADARNGNYLLLPIFGISFIIQFGRRAWKKRVQKLLKQRNEDAVIQNLEATEDEPHENWPGNAWPDFTNS